MARIYVITLIIGLTQTGCASLVIGGAAGAGGYYAGQQQHDAGKTGSDASITSAIKAKYRNDALLRVYTIGIDTQQGVVTLSGTVKSQAAASRAVELARGTGNVRQVVSRIGVTP
ncbi:MAG: BON domain-containing protein [Gammaproteobacteria bacterium]|nr:MAG: BON domain-containing protein [Gammaproteobacteria bacterium]